ncbi:MobH family relaxase [Marinobacter salicampi]|uniref:MobH family relaxase n=1 Tax=Marinobacter salicampi TaxID=435907 RepID=UPI00140CDC8A|nr:MobH family relaxase [Marinobacter salicampi]
MLKRSDEQIPQKWKDIEIYPPIARAIPAEPLDGILYRNRERILNISEALGLRDADFDSLMMPVIRNFASFVHLLPSSENHHHRGAGGALKHSLEVAFWSARAAEDIIFCRNADPRERRKIEPLWRVATCVAGLLHDAGKPIADVTVTDEKGELWHPLEQSLYEYLRQKKRNGYYISWRGGRYKRHEAFTQRAFDKIVPASFVTHMMAHDPNIMFAINDAFYSLDDSNHIAKIINWADHESVRRDAMEDVERKVGADFDYGLPVHRHIFNSIRRLVQSGKWTVNQPGAKIWHGDDGTFLVFKHGLTEIISDIKKEVGVTIRNDADGLVDELIQRGLVRPRYVPGGEPQSDEELGEYYLYWVITPKALEQAGGGQPIKLTTIKIDSAERIFRNEVPATADLKIWSTEDLGGGFQPEFGSGRGVSNVGGDAINTETGEVVARGTLDQPTEHSAPVSSPVEDPGGAGGDVQGQESSEESEVLSVQQASSNTGTVQPHLADPGMSPEDDPKQSLIYRARQGKPTPKPKKPDFKEVQKEPVFRDTTDAGRPEPSVEQQASQPKGPENDLQSVLAAIDDDMELPFGGGSVEPELPNSIATQGSPAVDDQASSVGTQPPEIEAEKASPSPTLGSAQHDASDTAGEKELSQVQEQPAKPKGTAKARNTKSAAPNPLLKKSAEAAKTAGGRTVTVKRMGKYKDIAKKPSDSSVLYQPVDRDPVAGFKQFITDNTASGAGQIIETLVDSVIHKGELLGKRWFIEDGSVAIAYPSAFEGITSSSADALNRLDTAKLLKKNPKQPMSKVMEVHEVMAIVLDDRTSEIIIAYLKVQEHAIDPLYVPPHPDLKVVKRAVKAVPDRNNTALHREKSKDATNRERQPKKRTNSGKKSPVKSETKPAKQVAGEPEKSETGNDGSQNLTRHGIAAEAMIELVDQMIAGTGELTDDMTTDGEDKSVPHSVVDILKIRYPTLTQSSARKQFWVAAKKRGFGWSVNKGFFTLRKTES